MTDTPATPPPLSAPGHALVPEITPSWRSAPDGVWERVRADYLAGHSAPVCSRRHGVGLSTLRERAAREGWRRSDQAWPAPARLDPDDEGAALEAEIDGDLDRLEMSQLADVAHRRMLRAVLRGDAAEALRWRRVRLAMSEEQAEVLRFLEDDRAYAARLAAARAPDGLDASDASDGVFKSAAAEDTD
jgi:hypothetical protein